MNVKFVLINALLVDIKRIIAHNASLIEFYHKNVFVQMELMNLINYLHVIIVIINVNGANYRLIIACNALSIELIHLLVIVITDILKMINKIVNNVTRDVKLAKTTLKLV